MNKKISLLSRLMRQHPKATRRELWDLFLAENEYDFIRIYQALRETSKEDHAALKARKGAERLMRVERGEDGNVKLIPTDGNH